MKIVCQHADHMTKMAAMPIYDIVAGLAFSLVWALTGLNNVLRVVFNF